MKKTVKLIDTRKIKLRYREYKQYCYDNDKDPLPKKSNDYKVWYFKEKMKRVKRVFDFIDSCKTDKPVLITGTVAYKDSIREIYPFIVESDGEMIHQRNGDLIYTNKAISKAVNKCLTGMLDFCIEFDYGDIVIHGFHQDGENVLRISKVSTRGYEYIRHKLDRGVKFNTKKYMFATFNESDFAIDLNLARLCK